MNKYSVKEEIPEKVAKELGKYPEILRKLLYYRDIKTEKEADTFLNPIFEENNDPYKMLGMDIAVKRISTAIENKEKIVIYSDYDADGIPGAVILHDFFKKIDYKNFENYIPHRVLEGFGLNDEAVDGFVQKGVSLIITIDCGIADVEEAEKIKKHGIDLIIVDHHLPRISEKNEEILPDALAILDNKQTGSKYPDKNLCASGVTFKLVQALIIKHGESWGIKDGWEKWLLDMAGLATLSDQVPLIGENRVIAYFGMKVLRKSPRPGLQKLLTKMNIEQKHLAEDDVGFMITPRLNAASRMDDPLRAYELLATSDVGEAGVLADHLSKINDERKLMVTNIMREVNKNFSKREQSDVVVLGNPKWKIGVLGLIAGKVMDKYKKPVFVWGRDENDLIKGSCRSDGSVSVVELMTETKEFFAEFGGHELAGGFTVHNEKIHFLEESLSISFQKVKREKKTDSVTYDVETGLDSVNMKNWKDLEKLAPFGMSNEKPIFLFNNVKVEKIKQFGKNGSGEHLEIVVSDQSGKEIKAVAFFSGLDSFKIPILNQNKINLLGTFDLSRFGGRTELRLRIVDII